MLLFITFSAACLARERKQINKKKQKNGSALDFDYDFRRASESVLISVLFHSQSSNQTNNQIMENSAENNRISNFQNVQQIEGKRRRKRIEMETAQWKLHKYMNKWCG